MARQSIAKCRYLQDLRFFSAAHNAAITGGRHPVASRQEVQSMQPKGHPLENITDHPTLYRLAPGAAIPAIVEAWAGSHRCGGPSWRTISRGLAILGAKLLARLPGRSDREPYTGPASKAVTGVT